MIRAMLIGSMLGAVISLTAPAEAKSAAPAGASTQCTPEHAAMGHCTMPETAPPPAPAPAIDPDCPPEHARMGHCTPRTTAPATTVPAKDAVGNAPPPPPATADYADRIWGREAMAPVRTSVYAEHGGHSFNKITIDLAELKFSNGHEAYKWEADAWFGGDINRLVLKTEGEGEFGESPEDVELTALYSRAIGPYFNVQAGLRHDIRPDPSRTYAMVGVEGLAPYWFEVDGYLYLSTKGEARASLSAEYDQRITQALILQPRIELDLAAQDMPDIGVGAGLSSGEIGLRLRYEIVREFAPYIGVVHEAKFGRTGDFARAAGQDTASTALVLGVRFWF